MSNDLDELEVPSREPDYISKRGVPYYWSPEWIRVLNGKPSRLKPVKRPGTVDLYMLAKDGNLSYIQGSIQQEFKKWHEDRQIDYMLLGVDPEELIITSHGRKGDLNNE